MRLFSSKQVAEITGVAVSTLDRWAAAGVVPTTVPAAGKGTGRRFSMRDVVLVEVARKLAALGIAQDTTKRIVGLVGEIIEPPIGNGTLIVKAESADDPDGMELTIPWAAIKRRVEARIWQLDKE